MARPQRVVAVPVDLALAFTAARGWHVLYAPPAGWLEEHDAQPEQDDEPQVRWVQERLIA